MEFYEKLKEKIDNLSQKEKAKICVGAAICCFVVLFIMLVVHFATVCHEKKRTILPLLVSMDGSGDSLATLELLLRRADVNVRMIIISGTGWSRSVSQALKGVRKLLDLLYSQGFKKSVTGIRTIAYGATRGLNVTRGICENDNSRFVPSERSFATDLQYFQPRDAKEVQRAKEETRKYLNEFGMPTTVLGTETMMVHYETELKTLLGAAPDYGVALLSTSSLTDFAAFFLKYPELEIKIQRFIVAGSAFGLHAKGDAEVLVPGNNVAECNMFFDPIAAKYILERSNIPVMLSSLDAAATVPVTSEMATRLSKLSKWSLNVWEASRSYNISSAFFPMRLSAASLYVDDRNLISAFAREMLVVRTHQYGLSSTSSSFHKREGQVYKLAGDSGKKIVGVVVRLQENSFWDMIVKTFSLGPPA